MYTLYGCEKMECNDNRLGKKPTLFLLTFLSFIGNTENMASITQHGATKPTAGQDVKKSKMARHSSLNITPACVSDQRQVSSAPCSPRPEHTGERCCMLSSISPTANVFKFWPDNVFFNHNLGLPSKPMDYSKMTSNVTTSQMPFGNSTE